MSSSTRPVVFMDINIGETPAGRMKMELFSDIVPKSVNLTVSINIILHFWNSLIAQNSREFQAIMHWGIQVMSSISHELMQKFNREPKSGSTQGHKDIRMRPFIGNYDLWWAWIIACWIFCSQSVSSDGSHVSSPYLMKICAPVFQTLCVKVSWIFPVS